MTLSSCLKKNSLLCSVCLIELLLCQWLSQFQWFKIVSPFLFLSLAALPSIIIIILTANLCRIKNKWVKWLLYIILSVLYGMVAFPIIGLCINAYLYGVFNYKALNRVLSDPMTYFILSLFTGIWLQFLLLACLYESFFNKRPLDRSKELNKY